uniref:(California timema) hypothetical protein n=1 Tax=Timema californicum TaxID=61474 RepID=A0A7R9IXZ2_TIMCA|nr:unnamed protein product [Timema californicum]
MPQTYTKTPKLHEAQNLHEGPNPTRRPLTTISSTQTLPPNVSSRSQVIDKEARLVLLLSKFVQFALLLRLSIDLQFPIDVSGVQKDHPFLDPDSLHSLFRRLHALNRCANMKVDNVPKNKVDDSDEDDSCALSENWTFQPESRRWSRVCDVTAQHMEKLQALSAASQAQGSPGEGDMARHPQEDEDDDEEEEEEDYDPEEIPVISSLRYGSLPPCSVHPGGDQELMAVRFRRTGSERLRDGAKALLKRMESLKSRRSETQTLKYFASNPFLQVLDVMTMRQRMKDLNCVDVSPTSPHPPSSDLPPTGLPTPTHSAPSHLVSAFGDDSSSYCSDGSSVATPPHSRGRSKPVRTKKNLSTRSNRPDDIGTLSDSEVQPSSWRHQYLKDANSNHTKVLQFIDGSSRGPQDQEPARRPSGSGKPQATRGGSLNLGKESQRYRDKLQRTFRKDVTVYRREKSGSPDYTGSQDSSSTLASQAESDHDDGGDTTPKHKAIVVRWHSFQRGSSRPDSYLFRQDSSPIRGAHPMNSLSCGQLLVLRKLALLKLTACMERYCPTHRTGWNWELPKFIRKIKSPDYKDKTVFGVPLLLSLQRNGQALPKCIQAALRWLRVNSLDQVGLFRKSGVRSRIQKLKLIAESQGESISYEGQQAYDVADMVKQYFRELPEALLTNKLSETFTAIFQHVPVNLRMEAVQCVVLLLPDEHREALQTLLEFLSQVSARAACNQMTASNLAVCLAPSLFHLHHAPSSTTSRSTSASPRRRKTVGVPDPRELSENKAAHDCLLYLIKEHKDLFMVTEEMMTQCHFSYMEESVPVALEELGTELHQDWRGYLYTCTTALLKEARDRSRGWVNVSCATDTLVDVAYKKVGDGHPLRLWRVSTEVEAPPLEVLQRVLRERHVWDTSLLKWRVVARLDALAEVFQYVCANMAPLAAKDFCVLRYLTSWRTDLPKGACVIVETSVEHPDGPVMLGGVRGIVLASRYLIEPCGSGKSRIMHLSRVDTKGRTPEWYNKSYGHICALYLTRIRTSFKHNADGPESKV